jgi:nitrogen PTS system EIIA component
MNLQKVLGPEVIKPNLVSKTKMEVVDELLQILVASGKVSNPDAARTALLDRERKMSTGMQHGVAIPHGKTDAVDSLIACMGISSDGIDFESLDGEPARIFIMTLSPKDRTGPHIQFLAEISQLLKSSDKRESLLKQSTAEEIFRVLIS